MLTGAQNELARLGVSEAGEEAPGSCPRDWSRPCAYAGLRPRSALCRLQCRRSRFLFSEGSRGGVPLQHGSSFGCRSLEGRVIIMTPWNCASSMQPVRRPVQAAASEILVEEQAAGCNTANLIKVASPANR